MFFLFVFSAFKLDEMRFGTPLHCKYMYIVKKNSVIHLKGRMHALSAVNFKGRPIHTKQYVSILKGDIFVFPRVVNASLHGHWRQLVQDVSIYCFLFCQSKLS